MKIKFISNNPLVSGLADGFWDQGCKLVRNETPNLIYLTSEDYTSEARRISQNNAEIALVYHVTSIDYNPVTLWELWEEGAVIVAASRLIKEAIEKDWAQQTIGLTKNFVKIPVVTLPIEELFYLNPIEIRESYSKVAAEILKTTTK